MTYTGKRLTKSSTDKMFAGVCGGIAEYLDIDPTVIRVLYAILTVFGACFTGVVLYIILCFILPDQALPPYNGGGRQTNI